MAAPLITARSLTRRYGAVTALDALTVAIEPGITGLVGANGAGKSTFVKILLGIVDPSEGDAEVMGYDVVRERANIRALVGYMPEHDCLPPDMSATEFVSFMARCSGLPVTAARERTAEVLRHVGLFEERYRPMGGYSTGMAQRVKLAQALVHDPRLLILDEPTNGLDPEGRDEMLALVSRTGREFGISVLVSSHLLGELERICERIVLIEQGRLLRAEQVGALTSETATLVVELDGDEAALAAFVARVSAAGLLVQAERQRVLVELPDTAAPAALDAAYDAVRDAAAMSDTGVLRLERRRGHLQDLFTGAGA
ncbi:ABC transporter ATP-binding protein [Gemmatimonas sp.]|uniref:ABC transporter ATP-binding protein n=2 Tax=Gemmatimonas sp. TaxID=1962908 RepID=UPI0025BC97C7|nr:ABC transporter ATP-binding protein [Gemmatimonas sp.]MCA2982915.1 ABC transporter ATP-binding protein [Gemmatimonas sp.]MCA2989727.1 ABC transporter ATP-binding protein [Gemmatimonas sp.]MCE2954313.1 ABC transporter ATP-binding protein [Gemmatimonas sp.]